MNLLSSVKINNNKKNKSNSPTYFSLRASVVKVFTGLSAVLGNLSTYLRGNGIKSIWFISHR